MTSHPAEWHAARRTGVGGSDSAAILGLSPWRGPLDVWADKMGLSEPTPDNPYMAWGRILEPVVRQHYADATGRAVAVPPEMLRHPDHPMIVGNPDGITDDGRLLEIKTARSGQGWGDPGTDEIPPAYLIQVQHYMLLAGLPVADLAVLIGGSDFRIYEIEADAALHEILIERIREFWTCVERGIPPDPQSATEAARAFSARQSREASVTAAPEILAAIQELAGLRAAIKEGQGRADSLTDQVKAAMGDADTLLAPDGRVLATWKSGKAPDRLDTRGLRAAHPEIARAFTSTGTPTRRFMLKEKSE